jgi:molecular chaperone GrpE (heat shock protein)
VSVIENLNNEMIEKKNLLSEERDRSQALESQIEEVRKKNFRIMATIEDMRSHLRDGLAELVGLRCLIL